MYAGEHSDDAQAQLARAKAYLMKADKDGVSVYDQLTRLMEQVLDETDDNHSGSGATSRDALVQHVEAFDEVLRQLRTHMFVSGASTSSPSCAEAAAVAPDVLATLLRNRSLLDRPAPQVHTTIEQPNPYTTITTTTMTPPAAPAYPSISEQNPYWIAAGVGLREDDAFLLDRAVTRLAMEKGLQDVRFVGKIFGLRGDYYVIATRRYVAEGEKVYAEAPTTATSGARAGLRLRHGVRPPVPPEPAYVGCNRLSFWVTSSPAASWTLLPDVTPQQIVAARAVRRYLTGDLDAPVVASPSFVWPEAVLLRAQLARLTASTTIAPLGALDEVEHDDDDEDDDDEDDEQDDDRARTSRGNTYGGERDTGAHDGDTARTRPRKAAVYRALTAPSPSFAVDEPVDVTAFAQQLSRWVHAERRIRASGRQTRVPVRPPREDDDDDDDSRRREKDGDDDSDDDDGDSGRDEEDADNDGDGRAREHDDDDDDDEGNEDAAERDEDDDDGEGGDGADKELLVPISGDHLYAVVDVPQPPPPPHDDEEDEEDGIGVDGDDDDGVNKDAATRAQEEQQRQQQQQREAARAATRDNAPRKPLHDDDVADDDVTRSKVAAWTLRLVGTEAAPTHAMAVVRSLVWPGAVAYITDGGRRWGCVYFGNGVRRSDACYTPPAAPRVQRECADLIEAADPTAAVEKLIRRGEEVPEADSEDEVDEDAGM